MGERNPFRVTGPGVINFSGGRTSAYMLYRILDAYDGKLPPDLVVCFANTGREMPATLDFVDECSRHWGVHVNWLEYRRDPDTGKQWAESVSHNSASRAGEPFEMLLEARGWMLPGPRMRFCTEELKMRTVHRFVASELGFGWHTRYIGLRADEMHRVERIAHHNKLRSDGHRGSCPLAKARIMKLLHIMPFWAGQLFDLDLTGDWEGNCDGCFLKRLAAIQRMSLDHPEQMVWWADKEARSVERGYSHGRFRIDREGYAEIAEWVRRNPRLPGVDPDPVETWDAFADCEGGCGL